MCLLLMIVVKQVLYSLALVESLTELLVFKSLLEEFIYIASILQTDMIAEQKKNSRIPLDWESYCLMSYYERSTDCESFLPFLCNFC